MMDMEEITFLDNVFPTALVALKQRKALVYNEKKKAAKGDFWISESQWCFSALNSLHHDSGRAAGEASPISYGSSVVWF